MRSLKFISTAFLMLTPLAAQEKPKYDWTFSNYQRGEPLHGECAVDQKNLKHPIWQVLVTTRADPPPQRPLAEYETFATIAGDVTIFTRNDAKVTINVVNKTTKVDKGNVEPTSLQMLENEAKTLYQECVRREEKAKKTHPEASGIVP